MTDVRRALSQWAPVRAAWRAWNRPREARAAGTTEVANADSRLLIGPANSAEQGYAWARAAERLPDVAAASFMLRGPGDVFRFRADHAVSTAIATTNPRWQRAQRRAVLERFTHVIAESGRPLWGEAEPVRAQLQRVRDAGLALALLWHGSDIRIPSVHAGLHPDSPFRDGRYADTAVLERVTRANHALSESLGVPVFVSTPDLLVYAPQATWLPVIVDVDRWAGAGAQPTLQRERPVVVHAPSNAGLKGSELIADTMRRLHDERLVEYREVRGVPADEMPAVYGDADIVLDQFVIGTYGVAAGEAMVCSRLVVSYVGDQVRDVVTDRTGLELPIVETRAGELEARLRAIVADRARFREIAERGPAFVHAVHDGAASARALAPFLGRTDSSVQPVRESSDG